MVRKRASKTKGSGGHKKPRALNRADGRIKKWDKASDVPMDEEDQFHSSRDKILLDGNDDEDDDGDDEEVFALDGIEDEEDEEDQEDDEDEPMPSVKKTKTTKKKKGKGKATSDSDSSSSEEEEESWGQSRAAYYSSNAANLESDDEEGHELEEQEAKRLQAKARQEMTDDDFGFNDPIDLTGIADEDDAFAEPLAPVVQQLPQDDAALIRHFEKVDPESLALARDWTDTAASISKTQQHLKAAREADGPHSPKLGMMHLYYQTLLTYGSTLAFYIHLRSSPNHAQHLEGLKSHPIISRLITLKQSLITMEDMDFGNSDSELDDDDESDFDEEMDAQDLWGHDKELDDTELSDLLSDAGPPPIPKIRIKPLQAPPLTLTDSPPKKKRKTSSPSSSSGVVFDLVEPQFTSQRPTTTPTTKSHEDAYGEATELQHADAADKSARKKSLRFHTSRIESASARRRGARSDTVGGDDDIPYRERKKAKDMRMVEEAKRNLERQGGADLDDAEPEPMDVDEEDAEGYYELVKKAAKEKKEKRKAEHEARSVRVDHAEEETSGPRSVSRAILKNRGLTPHRPKSVRNPRVKKRQKFDEAKKKVASQKAVYKGGADAARYEGERSGISKVVKSVRLG